MPKLVLTVPALEICVKKTSLDEANSALPEMSKLPSATTSTELARFPSVPGPTKVNPLVPNVVSRVPFAEYLETRARSSPTPLSKPDKSILPSADVFMPKIIGAPASGDAMSDEPLEPNEVSMEPSAFRR